MSFIDVIVAKIAPHDCIGCGAEGSLLCQNCLAALPDAPEGCYRCHAETADGLTCSSCRLTSDIERVEAATLYQGVAKKLIWKLKSSGAQEAASLMAKVMTRLAREYKDVVVISIPTASTRVRQRGYDQAKLLGREFAKQAKLFWVDCLARQGQAHQVGANREQRVQQLQSAFRVSQKRFVRGAHIILVDDVVTTGATLESAARVLKAAGANRIDALVFAKPTLRNG